MSLAKNRPPAKKAARRIRSSAGNESAPAIFKYRDALRLPVVDAAHLDASLPASVFIEAPGKTRRFMRRAPEFHDDPDGVGLFSGFTPDTITYPPAFVATARNARVVGFRTVLSENGFFFNDDSVIGPEERRRFLTDLAMPYPLSEETGLRPAGAVDRFALDPGDRITQRVEGTAVLLSSQEPPNYGSWLFRVLPKLHTLAQINLCQPLRYLVWAEIPTFQEYLRLLDISDDQIIHHDPKSIIYHVDRVIVPSIRNNQAFLDPESLTLFAKLRDRLGGPQQPGERIYVSRILQSQNGSSRDMLNEAELVERLVDLDFRIVAPETLSVPEQILAFSSAEMVVGPSGSGMFNVVFCHPGTKIIDLESEPHWIHAHVSLFASCGLRYGIFVGRAVDRDFREHHKPWKINIDALISRIGAFSR
jgi:capsular polysaccharide biosynthesis protein